MQNGLRVLPEFEMGGRYFIGIIDNSPSSRDTVVDGISLLSIQVTEMNRLLGALKFGNARDDTWVLLVTLDGALKPGWQRLMDVKTVDASELSITKCSPILDILAGILDLTEHLAYHAAKAGVNIQCGLMVATDGLEGVTIDGTAYPISMSSMSDVKRRVSQFLESDWPANVLAIGADGGTKVSEFFSELGFEKHCIRQSGLELRELRRAFNDVSDSSCAGLSH